MSTTEGRDGIRALVVPPGGESYLTTLERDASGSTYNSLSDLIDGCLEAMGYLFDNEPTVYVNDEGLLRDDLEPNRAIYATPDMVKRGYASRFGRGVVREGELFDFIKGNMGCVGYDPSTGEDRDISDDEVARVRARLDTPRSIASAYVEPVVIAATRGRNTDVDEMAKIREGLFAAEGIAPDAGHHTPRR